MEFQLGDEVNSFTIKCANLIDYIVCITNRARARVQMHSMCLRFRVPMILQFYHHRQRLHRTNKKLKRRDKSMRITPIM